MFRGIVITNPAEKTAESEVKLQSIISLYLINCLLQNVHYNVISSLLVGSIKSDGAMEFSQLGKKWEASSIVYTYKTRLSS